MRFLRKQNPPNLLASTTTTKNSNPLFPHPLNPYYQMKHSSSTLFLVCLPLCRSFRHKNHSTISPPSSLSHTRQHSYSLSLIPPPPSHIDYWGYSISPNNAFSIPSDLWYIYRPIGQYQSTSPCKSSQPRHWALWEGYNHCRFPQHIR